MSVNQALKGAKLIETLENYGQAKLTDNLYEKPPIGWGDNRHFVYDDQMFWDRTLRHPDETWYESFELFRFTICDWVARVPGLYYVPGNSQLRKLADGHIQEQYQTHRKYKPPGKSMLVMGGVGTLRLPPDEDGQRLVMLCAGLNASAGIPALISPTVFDHHHLRNGHCISIRSAIWRPMADSWIKRFATTANIPKGYLVVDNPDNVEVEKTNVPVMYHPFSIMEYEERNALVHDFVFLTMDDVGNIGRRDMEMFFQTYAEEKGRFGKYLIAPDMIHPIMETEYSSPMEINKPGQAARLEVLIKSIRDEHFDAAVIRDIQLTIPEFYDRPEKIVTLARNVGISPSTLGSFSARDMASELILQCLNRNKVEELIDRISVDFPKSN